MARDEQLIEPERASVAQIIDAYRAELVVPPDDHMRALSAAHIEPNIVEIIKDLKALRVRADEHFSKLRDQMRRKEIPVNPALLAKLQGYPVSCCLEITRYMLTLMSEAPAAEYTSGLKAVHDFYRAGGQVKRIWGALRETYFQNAIQAGEYYIDVANDTVDPMKEKVEILTLADSGFRNLQDFHHYANVGEKYWKCRMIPNWFFPNLAPLFPIITINAAGALRFDSKNIFMFPKNIESNFLLASDFLSEDRHIDFVASSFQSNLKTKMASVHAVDEAHFLSFSPRRDDEKLKRSFETYATATAFELKNWIWEAQRQLLPAHL